MSALFSTFQHRLLLEFLGFAPTTILSSVSLLQTVYIFSLLIWITTGNYSTLHYRATAEYTGCICKTTHAQGSAVSLLCVRNNNRLPFSCLTRPLLTIKKKPFVETTSVRPWHNISDQPLSGFSWNSAQWPFNEPLLHIREIKVHRPSGSRALLTGANESPPVLYTFLDRFGWNLVQEAFTHAVKHCDLRKNRTLYPLFPLIFVNIGTMKANCSYGPQWNYTDPRDIQKVKNASLMTSLSHGVQQWPVRSQYRQWSYISHNKHFPAEQALCAHYCQSVLQHFHTAG